MARERLQKGRGGRPSNIKGKEVMLSINSENTDGAGRTRLRIRFLKEACKKASNTNYVIVELDRENGKLYFLTGTAATGYTLSGKADVRTISIAIDDVDYWEPFCGKYDLFKDVSEGLYYIDFAKVEREG